MDNFLLNGTMFDLAAIRRFFKKLKFYDLWFKRKFKDFTVSSTSPYLAINKSKSARNKLETLVSRDIKKNFMTIKQCFIYELEAMHLNYLF